MNREDFNLVDKYVYFDNSATSLKPRVLANTISDYYNNYSANIHRGDYDISGIAEKKYEEARYLVSKFINCNTNEVVFTSGTTDSINKIVFGFFRYYLNAGDEVIISKAEHASNILPWLELEKEIGIVLKYVELENYRVTIDNIKKITTDNTKVISLAHITNVLGDIRPIKEIAKYAHSKNILVNVDGAQAAPHIKIDMQDLDCDFYSFSAHKMCGPTGVGVLYGKFEYLDQTKPIITGGGMNASFDTISVVYDELPERLEAGTPNIAGVIGLGAVIKYLNDIGMDKIEKYDEELRDYAYDKLKKVNNIIIYNKPDTSVFAINIKDIFAQDLSIYLNKYGICTRAGNHCAKILKEEIGIKNTTRISLYFYNTKEEIDKLVEVLNNENIKREII